MSYLIISLILLTAYCVKQTIRFRYTIIEYTKIGLGCIKPFLSWRILVCYLPFWFIFTGWTYVALAIGNTWWKTASGVWLAWMWMPWCPEKLITIPLTIWLHKKLFPKHSTSDLDSMLEKEKASVRGRNKKNV